MGMIKDKWSWPTLILYGLIAASCVLFIFGKLWPPIPQEVKDKVTEGNIESKVRQWLDVFHLPSGKVPDDRAFFHYVVTSSKSGMDAPPPNIVREKEFAHHLTIASKIKLSKEHQEAYDKFSDQQKSQFLMMLSGELAKAKILTDPDFSHGIAITIYNRTPISSLTEVTFWQKIDEVDYGFIIAYTTINLGLGRISATQPSPTPSKEASPH